MVSKGLKPCPGVRPETKEVQLQALSPHVLRHAESRPAMVQISLGLGPTPLIVVESEYLNTERP